MNAGQHERQRRIYIDTSAYLEILLDDTRADRLKSTVRGVRLLSSTLLILEARRSLVRLAREHTIDAGRYEQCVSQVQADIERLDLRDLSVDLCGTEPLPAVATPRSLDLVHLRTAIWFHQQAPIDRFVTLDAAQAQAARQLGLPVLD